MKIWTQEEYDRAGGVSGVVMLGTGDFRKIDFKGRHRVSIGPHSIIGDGARLGSSCEIGHHSEVGADFEAGTFCDIGAYCQFRSGAHVGANSRIGEYTEFAGCCRIDENCAIGGGVKIGDGSRVFNVPDVLGKTILRIDPVEGRTVYAFLHRHDGSVQTRIAMSGRIYTQEEFETMAADWAAKKYAHGQGLEALAAAKYIRSRMGVIA